MKPQKLIIALCGYKQSGKDTVANYLHAIISLADYPHILTHGFAHKLKDEVAALLGTSVRHLDANKKHPLIRHLYQWYGTEYARATFGEDYWIKQTDEMIKQLPADKPVCIIITDLRFLNEAAWVKEQGGVIVRIERKGQTNTDLHQSEREIPLIRPDFILDNNGTHLPRLVWETRCIKSFIWERYKISESTPTKTNKT